MDHGVEDQSCSEEWRRRGGGGPGKLLRDLPPCPSSTCISQHQCQPRLDAAGIIACIIHTGGASEIKLFNYSFHCHHRLCVSAHGSSAAANHLSSSFYLFLSLFSTCEALDRVIKSAFCLHLHEAARTTW